jgi:D-methionine transport system ATP-binding protein
MILDCKASVNIMFADMKDIEGKALGHMIVQLPKDALQAEKVIGYLRSKGINVEEAAEETDGRETETAEEVVTSEPEL